MDVFWHTYTYMYTYIHSLLAYIHTYVCMHVYICMCVCVYACMCMYAYMNVYVVIRDMLKSSAANHSRNSRYAGVLESHDWRSHSIRDL